MRSGLVVAAVLTAVACKSENELRYAATLQAETNGLALSDDGLDGYAGMVGTTCTIDTNFGCPTADADVRITTDERIVDHWNGATLAVSATGLHVIRGETWLEQDDVEVPALRTAALSDAGSTVVAGDRDRCTVQLPDGAVVEVDGELCADGLRWSVDRATGALFVATASGAVAVDADGERMLAAGADLVAWDSQLKQLYVATSGTRELAALDRAGDAVWTVRTGGPISGLAARGRRGEVLVRVAVDDGLTEVERRDGRTGRLLGTSTLPGGEGDLVVSDNGQTVAIVRETEVNFFHLETDGEEPTVDPTPPECITPTLDVDFPQRD